MYVAQIQQSYREIHKLKIITQQSSESVTRVAFARLLETRVAKFNLTLIQEFSHRTVTGQMIGFDGVLKNDMGLDLGYWEAKANVDFEEEIRKKLNRVIRNLIFCLKMGFWGCCIRMGYGWRRCKWRNRRASFFGTCQTAINPDISYEDRNEMLIQHILTEQIFIAVFQAEQIVRENNIVRELQAVEETFFKRIFIRMRKLCSFKSNSS